MAVDPREVEEMARIRRILAGEDVPPLTESYANTKAPISAAGSSDPKDDMKNILMRFYESSQSNIERVAESAENAQRFRTALETEITPNGVKVGSWEIQINEEAANKTFDVYNIHTNEPIATDLTLYESALAISKFLNMQMSITNAKIREVLDLEEKYASHRYEAAVFKRKSKRLNESRNYSDAAIADARYQESRKIAIKFRDRIAAISRSI